MKHFCRFVLPAAAIIAMASCAGCGSSDTLGPVADSSAAMRIRSSLGTAVEEGEGGAAEVATGTGWATLRGRFVYDGAPPDMSPYQASKDLGTCAPGGQAPPQETLVVDSGSGGIKNIAVYVRDARRVHESAQPTDAKVVFDQKVCVFLTHVMGVTVGQTVDLMNSDSVGHNTNIDGRAIKFNQTIPAGQSIPLAIQREEAAPAKVVCSIHPWMVAYLLPRENGYFAVTGDDGSFELPNLPAGEELEIQVWHESATGSGNGLVLNSAQAKEFDWSSRGRFKITLEQDSEQELELVVPPTAFSI